MNRILAVGGTLLVIHGQVLAQPPGRRADSPAASPVPDTVVEQSFAPELVETGRALFASQCGFCHGLDTAGGSGGPDLTRSGLVARDVGGDLISVVVRGGREDAEVPMPAFPAIEDTDLAGLVAYVHDQKDRAESAEGGRRSVSVDDVLSGDVAAGRRFFERNCAACHSADGDLAGIASRMQGLTLMQRMLYPRPSGRRAELGTPRVVVTTQAGDRFSGLLAYEDEFTIALTDLSGRYRSFATRNVEYEVQNPLDRHLELLDIYTDEDMHDVLTYLHTLR